ncbi:hypothetical protein [Rubellimicrobium arenae]|uniref:hypothetical protein n=1 Tax=Rubellimicrobium arenae TaxID=2817372 RepID=UPI001B315DCC|nr:hypothetical protein [Rubellimicrobium arenae]
MTDDWGDLAGAGFENFRLSHRDRALGFIENHRDFEAQLFAIKGALERNKEAEQRASDNIQHMREQINLLAPEDHRNRDHLDDYLTDMFHDSVYSDAAHSMAAVGMLAPYFESLFVALFDAIGKKVGSDLGSGKRAKAFQEIYWNPQVVIRDKRMGDDLVVGIMELATEVGLLTYLPQDLDKTLKALFAYRNNMFHNGFEWPLETRQRFQNRSANQHWPKDWFEQSTSGDDPWIFYMSEKFITRCLATIDEVLDGVGRFLKERNDG